MRTRAVNDVWDSEKPVGADWPNVCADALMTDCDDTDQTAEACYGQIRFLPDQAEPGDVCRDHIWRAGAAEISENQSG